MDKSPGGNTCRIDRDGTPADYAFNAAMDNKTVAESQENRIQAMEKQIDELVKMYGRMYTYLSTGKQLP